MIATLLQTSMSDVAPRFSGLADLSNETSSERRRDILRWVTETLHEGTAAGDDLTSLDELLASVAADYSVQVRAELAKLVAISPHFGHSAATLALDDIQVAAPVLIHSRSLDDATLLRVIAKNSQPHMLAVTRREEVSETVSHALVNGGGDEVVISLLSNTGAQIGCDTYDVIAERAKESSALQAPMVRRKDVPPELLNELYLEVEVGLRREILEKFATITPDELDKAFQRSRRRTTKNGAGIPEDMEAARNRVSIITHHGGLSASDVITLMREGKRSRTAFILGFAQLTDVGFELARQVMDSRDLDTLALLCRGADLDAGFYVALAIALGGGEGRLGPNTEDLGTLYKSVPVQAARRAIRFWKARGAT